MRKIAGLLKWLVNGVRYIIVFAISLIIAIATIIIPATLRTAIQATAAIINVVITLIIGWVIGYIVSQSALSALIISQAQVVGLEITTGYIPLIGVAVSIIAIPIRISFKMKSG